MTTTAGTHPETHGIPPDVYHRRWLILAILNLSLVIIVIAVSSLNVAIPTIQRELGASGTELQWIIDAYALVFAGLLLPGGALGDRFGRKGMLLVGLVIFGSAALAASQATDPNQLIAMRTLMGVGAALIMPATLSIILNSFPMHERPKAIALWAAFAGVGGALGPITSGVLLEHYWWGSVFM
ncbi:MAG: MFS transporter, partial [Actinobacteria bacterium]